MNNTKGANKVMQPVSWALGLQGFWLKGALHLLFGIEVVCILNHNRFFGITMLFEFVFFFCILNVILDCFCKFRCICCV